MRDPRYDVLFEPVPIGPVVARNRFYQVPHCNGMGHRAPRALAAMRGVKAEGGWAVVCTEETEIHPTSDLTPFVELRNHDDRDIASLALTAEAVHAHGALAGIELVHNGLHVSNRSTREPPLAPAGLPVHWTDPVQARRMDSADIAQLRRWHRDAVERSIRAGFDLVYVYAGHGMSVIQQFLSRRYNDRDDEYGGAIENRARLLREILEETREICDGKVAVACRICVDEELGPEGLERGEIEEVVGMLAEHPDLWDFQLGGWETDSATARFTAEGYQEDAVRGLKRLTTKPVVAVGRFTSPDTMVRQVDEGVLDLVGAARPSIADPFLPAKLEQGRLDDIRECIGCNICVSGDFTVAPIRCTQNPTMGEEWRRGWHPERVAPKKTNARVLVVGAGPAGLEAAQILGKRGYEVVVVEATRDIGGRASREATLPGLGTWRRVIDHRAAQIDKLDKVEIFRESPMGVTEALGYGFDHIAVATGASWRADGVGRHHTRPVPIAAGAEVLTPDDLMAGVAPRGPRVLVYDDDHYYLGGVLAEHLAQQGCSVEIVTPEALVSAWTVNTMEQTRIHRRLHDLGVGIRTQQVVTQVSGSFTRTENVITGEQASVPADSVVMVTARMPDDGLGTGLRDGRDQWGDGGLRSVRTIGDAWAPSTIASAVWWGHRYGRELDAEPDEIHLLREFVTPGRV
ncbi:MAG: FAD-dependent oxidoreductase [Acidimicrobiales bacterium]